MRQQAIRGLLIVPCALSLITMHLSPATAVPDAPLITCVDLDTGKERISKNAKCRTSQEATAKWRLAQTDSVMATGIAFKTLTVCSNKESSPVNYQLIRNACAKHMKKSLYTRSSALPAKPIITQVSSFSSDSAFLALATDPTANLDAPIAYYTVTSSKGDVKKVLSWRDASVTVNGLMASTSYTFTITATSADGTSLLSASSLPVTTQVYVAPVTTAPLSAPAFTLSAIAETKTAGTSITGYTIASSGGTIANYAISPSAPTGLTFNSTTGLLSGTPSSTQSATTYTITATNASGSATRTFTLTVTAIVYTVGQTGPGGGKIFYVSNTPFTCGPTRAASCNYLEAAPTGWQGVGATDDLNPPTNRTWSPAGQRSAVIASQEGIGWGYEQSLTIAGLSGSDTTNNAAKLARSYSVTIGSVTYSDWFLPSKDELNQMFIQKTIIGLSDAPYFSSTDNVNDDNGTRAAYSQSMQTGAVIPDAFKYYSDYVRPIRAF
jgi:hypothetical protein